MYEWRKMTTAQRQEVLESRKQKKHPWHSPPHRVGETDYYHISAACYEHKPIIGLSPKRMFEFSEAILALMNDLLVTIFAWCLLPNHYHLLIKTEDIFYLLNRLGNLHGRLSYFWNGEDDCRGRKVWFNAVERYIRSERHFWACMNYVHHNSIHHNYVKKWTYWPFSSAIEFLAKVGRDKAAEIWREYPILDFGKGWDDPEL